MLPGFPRLDVMKALGDDTRYAIYLEIARSSRPLATAEIAEVLDLHPNTVRPHLERMREVGLLDVAIDSRGGVGRPQHRYSIAPDAPSLGTESASMPMLAGMVLSLAKAMGAGSEDAAAVGRRQGRIDAGRYEHAPSSLEALVAELDRLGFDPAVTDGPDEDTAVVGFAHCPFRALAEENPEIVCALHRGLVEGFVETTDDAEVREFCTLVHRTSCQVSIATR
ncbi:MAG: helix-turn-helix domain-containing protein [Ilumatobacteraceae bacterium]